MPIELLRDGFAKLPPNASVWKRWSRQVRVCTTISERNPKARERFRSTMALVAERQRHMYSDYWYIIHPFSSFRYYWQLLMLFVWLLLLPTDTFTYAFIHYYKARCINSTYIRVPLLLLNIVCVVDICLTFFTGFFKKEKSEVIFDIKQICLRYIKTYLIIDLFALVYIAHFISNITHKTIHALLVIPILLRHIRLKTVLKNLKMLTRRGGTIFGDNLYKVLRLIIFAFLTVHTCTCIYVKFASQYIKCDNCWLQRIVEINAKDADPIIFHMQLMGHAISVFAMTRYEFNKAQMKCFEVTDSSTTECTTPPIDLTFHLVLQVMAIAYHMYMLTMFYKIMKTSYYSSLEYCYFIESLKSFMCMKDVTGTTQRRILKYFDNRFDKCFFYEKDILQTFSSGLYLEYFMQYSESLLSNSKIFQHCSKETVNELTKYLTYTMFLPGDYIIRYGEDPDCMYFILSGTVYMVTETGTEIAHLHDGDHFGEFGILLPSIHVRQATVIADDTCQMYRLTKKDFYNVIPPDSALFINILRIAQNRMRENLQKFRESKDITPEDPSLKGVLRYTIIMH